MLFSANFGVIVILFLLPFVTVSCGGQVMNIPVTGVELAFGKHVEVKTPAFMKPSNATQYSPMPRSSQNDRIDVPPSPLAALALILAVFGMLVGFMAYIPARIIAALTGLTGGILLLVLKMKMDNEALSEGAGMFMVSYGFPYWLSLLLFLGTAAGCAYSAYQIYQRENGRDGQYAN